MLSTFIIEAFVKALNNFHLDFSIIDAGGKYLITLRNLPIELDLLLSEAKYEECVSDDFYTYMRTACCSPSIDIDGNRMIIITLDNETGCKKINTIGHILSNYFNDVDRIVKMDKEQGN